MSIKASYFKSRSMTSQSNQALSIEFQPLWSISIELLEMGKSPQEFKNIIPSVRENIAL